MTYYFYKHPVILSNYKCKLDYNTKLFWPPLLNDLKRVLAADVAIVAGSNKLMPTSFLKIVFITNTICPNI